LSTGIAQAINETNLTTIYTTYDLLPKVCNLLNRCPNLSTVIYVDPQTQSNHNIECNFPQNIKLLSISKLVNDGKEAPESLRGVPLEPNEIQIICYTSGSTDKPKGVYLTGQQMLEAGNSGTAKFCSN